MAVQQLPQLEMVLFVECGVAAWTVCSIPCIRQIVPNGYDGLVLTVKVGCTRPDEVDVRVVKNCFPYGKVFVQVVQGGLEAASGVRLSSMGDTEDAMLLAVVAVTVGYGLRPEDCVEV